MINYNLNPADILAPCIFYPGVILHLTNPAVEYTGTSGGWINWDYESFVGPYIPGWGDNVAEMICNLADFLGYDATAAAAGFVVRGPYPNPTIGEPLGPWSGVAIDNLKIYGVRAGDEVYKEVRIIPELKAATPSDPADIVNLEFIWEDMPTGNFVEEKSVPDDYDNSNNVMGALFTVITDIACAEIEDIKTNDLTQDLESHWHITTSGYNNYLWCGDEETGVYGSEWDDVVLLAPGQDPVLDMGGFPMFSLDYDDYGEIEGWPFDEGWFEWMPDFLKLKPTSDYPCGKCDLIALCGQCPGWAWLEHGSPETPVDYLCKIAHLRAQAFHTTEV